MTPNEELRDSLIRRQVYLLRYAGGIGSEIVRLLDATEKDLEEAIKARARGAALRGRDTGPAVTARLKALFEQIAELRAAAFAAIGEKMTEDLGLLAGIESQALVDLIQRLSPIDLGLALPRARQLASTVASLFDGDTLKGWLKRMRESDYNRIKDQIAIGFTQGETVDAIAERVLGTAKLNYRDGVAQITRNGARTLARTAVNHIANQSRQAVYAANDDVFSLELYTATLDSRTTPICRSLDGKEFKIGKGPIPPLHPNCRSVRVPVIGERLGDRASQFGPVPAQQTYGEWLSKQSAAFQDDVLGPERAVLFRDGNLPIERFSDASGRLYTLAELRKREPAAFRKAADADT